jgi:hypothetical protein
VRRAYRADLRLLLGLARLARRPLFDFWVIEEGGKVAATTLLTYGPTSGMVSTVAVRPPFRRRGYARALLAAAHGALRRYGRRWAVLEVLAENAPAIALYRALGYRRVRGGEVLARPLGPGAPPLPDASPGDARIRPFARRDAAPLVRVAEAPDPAELRALLPVTPGMFSVPPLLAAIVGSATEAWVLDGPEGPRAFLRATAGAPGRPAHLTQPILAPEVGAEEARAFVAHGLRYLSARSASRAVVELPDGRPAAARALLENGCTRAYRVELDALDLGMR